MTNQSTELKELPNQEVVVLNTLQTALEKGVDADSLEKILNMQERILDRQAEQAYTQSMVTVQSEMEPITLNKENMHTRSKYAGMGQIIKQITPIYTKAGFALSFAEGKPENAGEIRVTCDVMHSQGHTKHYFVDMPLVVEGIKGEKMMTETHGTGSAFTYGQRYLTKLIFNLNTGDDDDGNSAGGDSRSTLEVDNAWIEQMLKLRELIPSINAIKQCIQDNKDDPENNGLEAAVEAWLELTEDQARTIWQPAATKGGVLTTYEHEIMKSNEWAQVRDGME